jgi:arylsulfatase A-like enzyme
MVLWSDHGWHLGEKHSWRKFTLWEEATNSVMLMHAPGLSRKNSRCTAPVSLIDIYPTLIDLAGLPEKEELEGQSLIPLLMNPEADWERPALTTHGRNNHALRTKKWRYIRYEDGSEELYNHELDSMEWNNLAGDKQYQQVKAQLAGWFPQENAPNAAFDPKK